MFSGLFFQMFGFFFFLIIVGFINTIGPNTKSCHTFHRPQLNHIASSFLQVLSVNWRPIWIFMSGTAELKEPKLFSLKA